MTEWADVLSVDALQELGGRLLTQHILPHLHAHLEQRPAAAALPLAISACERAMLNLRAGWRAGGVQGGTRNVCARALHAFVGGELVDALRSAPTNVRDACRAQLATLLEGLDDDRGAGMLRGDV